MVGFQSHQYTFRTLHPDPSGIPRLFVETSLCLRSFGNPYLDSITRLTTYRQSIGPTLCTLNPGTLPHNRRRVGSPSSNHTEPIPQDRHLGTYPFHQEQAHEHPYWL